ncbi:MAG: type 1 glutamine amidotransferase [Pseudobdellovibrionaceae bacterium]
MRKILVFQHVAHEILGTLNPLLKSQGLQVRYVNFGRKPDSHADINKYSGLIILGGPMGVYEADSHAHITTECKMIEQALKKDIPILGICLGSQMLAHVLGADVRKSNEKEIGWYDIHMTKAGLEDPLFNHFQKKEKIFQLHGDTFDIPKTAEHLAFSEICTGQAFRYGKKAYGMQFHLEVDKPMIHRWLKVPANAKDLEESNGKFVASEIEAETDKYIANSFDLSVKTFLKFIDLLGIKDRPKLVGTTHNKSKK